MGPQSWSRARAAAAIVASLRFDWLPRLAEPGERRAVGAVFLALALIGAPLAGSMESVCRQCPVSCPMHQPAKTKAKPTCHAGGTSAAHHDDATQGIGFTRPPCSDHGVVPGVALAPMILPEAVHSAVVLASRGPAASRPLAHVRSDEPPDTPPPIVSA
jgi:hypothetical protein